MQTQLLRRQIREQQYLLRACREPRAPLSQIRRFTQRESHVCSPRGTSLEGRFARSHADQLAEGLTEFGVEHSVYYGIHKAVHITQPGGDDESCDTGLTGLRQFCADCIHNVTGEEGNPAYQKDPYGINWDRINQCHYTVEVNNVINLHFLKLRCKTHERYMYFPYFRKNKKSQYNAILSFTCPVCDITYIHHRKNATTAWVYAANGKLIIIIFPKVNILQCSV